MTSIADRNILIIEDDEFASILLGEYLKKLGYQKIYYCKNDTSGTRKFKELFESNNVPVVFLDYHFPDITALLVLKQILEIYPRTDVIVEMAVNQSKFGIMRLSEFGVRYYLLKPYKLEKLKEIMNTLEAKTNQITHLVRDASLLKSVVSLAVEKTLLGIGKLEYEKVVNKLKEDHKCSLLDCYENPEYLKKVLCDIYGKSYGYVLESIKENMKEFESEEFVQEFFLVMNG